MNYNPTESYINDVGEIGKLATIWELKFRLLCQNLGLESYKVNIENGKEVLYAPPLWRVLKSLYEEYPYLHFEFSFAHNLRNAIAHSNFVELSNIVHEGLVENLHTQVISGSFKDGGIIDLKEDIPEGKLKDVSVFGLLLRSINARTVNECTIILNTAIEAVEALQDLRAYSGKGKFFSKLFKEGQIFDSSDFVAFDNEWKHAFKRLGSGDIFLQKYYSYFHNEKREL